MDVRAHKTSLTPPFYIRVHVLRQEIERSCTCVKGIDFPSIWELSDSVVTFGFLHFLVNVRFNHTLFSR